ncbi:CinA family protein [Alcanivorax sp. DG881]|jgi:nicotinamide-nucleotide amidase|uniref:CinA family protein n=1 Tax=Alcanivorax sp. DG881 TaxID=236097 RepID=UPI00017EC55B|nr:competence/damage-inducible protein CinA C-terminal domain [Alcanivorax sp. DG881]HIL23414.1 CinA family protein [Alcanivorax sp.]
MPIRDEEILAAAQALAGSLAQQRLLLTTAESCTGGGIAETLTGIAGASAWFDRGFVTYSNEAKLSMLGVSQSTLDRFGAVSEATALEMARGAISHSGAHVSVAVTGIAGPDGGTPDKPVGTVWIAWGQKLGYAEARRFQFDGDRNAVRQQAILEAILGLNARLK